MKRQNRIIFDFYLGLAHNAGVNRNAPHGAGLVNLVLIAEHAHTGTVSGGLVATFSIVLGQSTVQAYLMNLSDEKMEPD